MSSTDGKRNRLPLISLVFLALVLSGGVFFWQYSFRQLQQAQTDRQLTQIARFFSAAQDSSNFCQHLQAINRAEFGNVQASLFSASNTAYCADQPDLKPATAWDSQRIFTSPEKERILITTLPVHQLILQVKSQNLSAAYIKCILVVLTLIGIIILLLFYWLQKLLLNRQDEELKELLQQFSSDSAIKPDNLKKPLLRDLAKEHAKKIQRLSEELTRARQFTSNVTHELRTPLTILRGETELSIRSNRLDDQLRRTLESNLEEINRMSYLIDDLLTLSKSDLGELPIRLDLLYLPEILLELKHQGAILAQNKQISVNLDYPGNIDIYISADSVRLRQVFLNLLTNAIRYTPEHGTITMKVDHLDDKVAIHVIDTGTGIDEKHLKKIFERFYRIDKTKNRNDGGSGLGLAIAEWIVNAHNGIISVTSEVGKGSCFTVTLPVDMDFTKKIAN